MPTNVKGIARKKRGKKKAAQVLTYAAFFFYDLKAL